MKTTMREPLLSVLGHAAHLDRWLIQTGARMRERFARAYDWLNSLRRVRRQRLMRRWRLSLAMLAFVIAASGMPIPVNAVGPMTVVADAAGLVTDGKCSLAEAIVNANNHNSTTWPDCGGAGAGSNTITLPSNVTFNYITPLNGDTALPNITSQVTIQGNHSTIKRDSSAIDQFRILQVYEQEGNLTLNQTTISGGNSAKPGGGIRVFDATLTLTNSTITGNTSEMHGGGIFNYLSTVTVSKSTISGNTTRPAGGGIFSSYKSTLTVTNSTISGNTAKYDGGGITSDSDLSLTITHSTISGNTASQGSGGGVDTFYTKTVTFIQSIVSGNTAAQGNEITVATTPSRIVTADRTNVFGNNGETNAQAFENFTPGASDIVATSNGTSPTPLNKILNPTLANNGGSTKTLALIAGSPAIDKIPNVSGCGVSLAADQRGVARPQPAGGLCDVGAFEYQAPVVPSDVPEGDTLLLLGGGLSGVGVWLRYQWSKRCNQK